MIFSQVVASRQPWRLLAKRLLDAQAIAGHDVDEVGEAGREAYQLEDFPDFRSRQPVNVVENHHNPLAVLSESRGDFLATT